MAWLQDNQHGSPRTPIFCLFLKFAGQKVEENRLKLNNDSLQHLAIHTYPPNTTPTSLTEANVIK